MCLSWVVFVATEEIKAMIIYEIDNAVAYCITVSDSSFLSCVFSKSQANNGTKQTNTCKKKRPKTPPSSQDRLGRADAVWYERTESQFSPRHSDRPVSRLSNSPFGFREPSEPPPERPSPQLVRRRSTDATSLQARPELDRVRRSFPRRTSTGTVT